MGDYNDGKWHAWNGGKCPVHMNSVVETVWRFKAGDIRPGKDISAAGNVAFLGNEYGDLIAFRVITEYRKPREWWISLHSANGGFRIVSEAEPDRPHGCILVREVL